MKGAEALARLEVDPVSLYEGKHDSGCFKVLGLYCLHEGSVALAVSDESDIHCLTRPYQISLQFLVVSKHGK